jgi:hypothetical protein
VLRLYLDIDGVFHNSAFGTESVKICRDGKPLGWFSNWFEWTPLLAEALEPFPVELYVLSTWRYHWEEADSQDLRDFLGPLGPKYIRCIPRHIVGEPRCRLAELDMAEDGYTGPFLFLDDEEAGYEATSNLVKLDSKFGVSDPFKLKELVSRIQEKLGFAP